MIKKSSIIRNNAGFMFPFVLVITVLVLLIITATAYHYQNNIVMTKNQIEQLKIETMVQMSRERVKQALIQNGELKKQMYFSFPYGDVSLRINALSSDKYTLFFTITTDNQSTIQLRGFLNPSL
ncbi:hypothetical protein CAI16_16855 [Virgibacillus dokdonensis]|uniref:ComG operon protein 7 n=1 Tax=Virgibacillus dokdonensis TaxID=302167 RepID=A0A3E0WIJ9_9BACI|nr:MULTISPECIES: competence type IV pilus minor pilin ComGG [Virgibacillus]RFA32810.1 hypothetical protein CAI16_16855 [Virgibacillus dokdonensis]